MKKSFLSALAVLAITPAAFAGIITFEDRDSAGAASAFSDAGINVTITCGDTSSDCFAFNYDNPIGEEQAYAPGDQRPVGAPDLGDFGLTDVPLRANGSDDALPFYLSFSQALSAISIDLLDFGAGGITTGVGRLDLFRGSDFTDLVGGIDFDPVNDLDPSYLNISSGGIVFRSAILTMGDVGAGLDNVAFEVPVPAPLGLLGLGLLGLGALRRRKA